MKKNNKLWFTLVELLVVITILAIISVVAYQNFGWAVDKAVSGRKISDVSTIETALQQYKTDKNEYPTVDIYTWSVNLWWYKSSDNALKTNTVKVQKNGDAIDWVLIDDCKWWWKVMWIDAFSLTQIWAKGTISQEKLWKQYLSKDLYDPELWDIKVWTWTMINYWLWRYIYAVYKNSTNWSSNNLTWNAYNMAYTIRKDWSDSYVTKIVWDYDEKSCFNNSPNCPATLIWSWNDVLNDWDETWIPYPVTDFPSS